MLLVEAERLKVSALSLLAAISNEDFVRVLGLVEKINYTLAPERRVLF